MLASLLLTVALAGNPTPPCTCLDCPCVVCQCTDCGIDCKCGKVAAQLQPPPLPADYIAVQKRVDKGEELIVYAGLPLPTNAPKNAVRINRFPGEKNGVYRCFYDKKSKEGKYVEVKPAKAPGKVAEFFPLQSIFPARDNCPNGNCPNATPARRGLGIFR